MELIELELKKRHNSKMANLRPLMKKTFHRRRMVLRAMPVNSRSAFLYTKLPVFREHADFVSIYNA